METMIIVREFPYWSSGSNYREARSNFKSTSGKFPSSKASIVAFSGAPDRIAELRINDMGDISYPKDVNKIVVN
jgi:hypothetical protein